MVWSDSKIDEDWERKLGERERREYGERERKRRKWKALVVVGGQDFYWCFLKKHTITNVVIIVVLQPCNLKCWYFRLLVTLIICNNIVFFQDNTSTKINNLFKLHPSSPKGILHISFLSLPQSKFDYVLSLFVEWL